jgi:16S rRNA (cytosine1402-N4)-methyltransferase
MGASSDAPASSSHTPVLYQEVLSALQPRAGRRYLDGTVGAGGHAAGILSRAAPSGELLGLDRDPAALAAARRRLAPFGSRVRLRHASYADMVEAARAEGWEGVDGVLLDLGLSADQLEDPTRGFSFRLDGPLDMRFDPGQPLRAEELVNRLPAHELGRLLSEFGEERRARAIAAAIAAARPLRSTVDLAEVVSRAAGRAGTRGMHPATRTFQALRIAVNGELETLEAGLEQALGLLNPEGRLAVISFHSLEDRIVKHFMRKEGQEGGRLRVLSRKPIRPGEPELEANPRARSAKLRVAERSGVA